MNPILIALLAQTSSTATVGEIRPTARYAIIVGVNHPLPGSNYDTLRYADDDALRFGEYFESVGASTRVLTAPDRDTADRYPVLADRAQRPTRQGLESALEAVERELREAEGQVRELYFVFSGHGSISSTLAYLHLFDDRFTRTDVYERILKRMPAERIHVIIDSCHSYFLVNARGRRVAVAEDEENLDRHPGAGFLLSTSDSREVQEWSGYRAGVFSYQVLGAMRGAADVDRDGIVTYDEVHAYIVAANLGVERDDARIQPHVRKPVSRDRALIDLRLAPRGVRAIVPAELGGHFYVMDGAVRVLDAHKPRGVELALLLPERSRFTARFEDAAYSIAGGLFLPEAMDDVLLTSSKGTVADEFRTNLFKTPLTQDFVLGLSAATPQVTHVHRQSGAAWYRDPLTMSLLGLGAASSIAGAFATVVFTEARQDANADVVTFESERARGRAQDWSNVMVATYAAGGALLISGILRAILTNEDEASFALGISSSGAVLAGSF